MVATRTKFLVMLVFATTFLVSLLVSLALSTESRTEADLAVSASAADSGLSESERQEKVDYEVARPELVAQAYEKCQTTDFDLPKGRDCLRNEFSQLISEHGPLPIVNGLGQYREERDLTCHQSMHVLGQGAYLAFGNLKTAFDMPKAGLCEYGYYHGVLQGWALSLGPESVIKDFKNLCPSLANMTLGNDGDCIHGSGHAVGIFLDPDVAARACSTLPDDEQVMYCWYGYEMEYAEANKNEFAILRSENSEQAEKRAFADLRACADHEHKAIQRSCFRFRPVVAHSLLPEPDRSERLLRFCAELGRWEKECVIGTVGELLAMNTSLDVPGAPSPGHYCEITSSKEIRAACFHMVAYTRLLLLNTYESGADACATAGPLEQECLKRFQVDWETYLVQQNGITGTGKAS